MRRSVILRGFLGAAICAAALTGVARRAPVVSRWLDGTNQARPDAPAAIATIPSDIGPAPGPDTAAAAKHKHKRRAPAKAKAHGRRAFRVGGGVVMVTAPGTAAGPAPAGAAPADAAPVPAQR